MTQLDRILRDIERMNNKNIIQNRSQREKLNPFLCEIVATGFGILHPAAEADYRESLVVIDSNPRRAMILQAKAFGRFALVIAKHSRDGKRKHH